MQVLNNLVENAIHYTPEGGEIVISTGTEEAKGRIWATATVAEPSGCRSPTGCRGRFATRHAAWVG